MRACAITLDVHAGDSADDLLRAQATLRENALRATYFVPTGLLADAAMRRALRAIDDGEAEIASHGRDHDSVEVGALASSEGALDFLDRSKKEYEDFFGRAPVAFRSPCWCGLSARALDRLALLGYRVDSSATPQRLGLLSSSPWQNPWLTASRQPRFVRPELLEVPTSSFLFPFGSMSLALLRKWGALAFAASLAAEAWCTPSVVVVQLHASDFVVHGGPPARARRLRDLRLVPDHGWLARHWFVDLDRERMNARTLAVLALFQHARLTSMTLSQIFEARVA
jgi:hypothetical protein